MNKTVNINLGGMFFHIDEDAYQKLTRYFDAIKRSLSNSSGQDEIIRDIEMRIGELITEKHTSDKQVIHLKEVDEIIAIMGQPEDYRIDDENDNKNTSSNFATTRTRKLYRDKDNGVLGGVLAGLGHYFGIDKVWLRILFLALVFVFGTGILAYIILWIVMPEAITTSEKLEMTGEPVTISNIEKKVREEFDNVSEKLKNADYDKFGNQIKSTASIAGSSIGDVILTIFKVFAKIMGVILIMSGLAGIVTFLIAILTLGSTTFMHSPWQEYIAAGNYTDYPLWTFGLILFFAIIIPFFFLTLLGFKLVNPNLKSIGNPVKYTLLGLWIIAIAMIISLAVKQATEIGFEGKKAQKIAINYNPKDTLTIKFRYNDYYTKDVNDRSNFRFVQDSLNNNLIYSNNVSLKVIYTSETQPYLQIERTANGKSFTDAKQRAEKIRYQVNIQGNQIVLDNYFVTEVNNKFRDQEVEIFLYLTEGTLFKTDTSVEQYAYSNNGYFNLHNSSEKYTYRAEKSQVKCLDCPKEENEHGDVIGGNDMNNDNSDTEVIINKDGVSIKNDTIIDEKREFKELKINEDGIIIKTK